MSISLLKNVVAVLLALATTLFLFALMYALIAIDVKPPGELQQRKLADIFMPEREIETQYESVKPKKIDLAQEPPPEMPLPDFDRLDLYPQALNLSAPRVTPKLDIKGVGVFAADGEYLPIVKVKPNYPQRALSRGIEGYVIVEFTITTNGSVRDPVVIEANPENIFNRASIKAVSKFKYKPRMIDGEPVEVHGVRNRITFKNAD